MRSYTIYPNHGQGRVVNARTSYHAEQLFETITGERAAKVSCGASPEAIDDRDPQTRKSISGPKPDWFDLRPRKVAEIAGAMGHLADLYVSLLVEAAYCDREPDPQLAAYRMARALNCEKLMRALEGA